MAQCIYRFCSEQDGQDIIEYSLLLLFIAIACLSFVGNGRNAVNSIWTSANSRITTASTAAGS